jgi:hypothetical protein
VPATGEAERATEWTRDAAKPRGTGQECAAAAAPRLPAPEPRRPAWWHQIGRGPRAVAASIRSIISTPEPEGARRSTPASAQDPHTGGAVAAVRARALQRVRGAGRDVAQRLPRLGVRTPTFSRRSLAAVAGSAAVLMVGARVGVPVGFWSPAPSSVVQAAATPPRAPTPAATPAPGPPTEHWLLVQHTDGLGLVLRPAPGSPERVLTLQEGARLRVIGDPVEQAGRSWLPVASPSGKSGWVAGDFVAPAP